MLIPPHDPNSIDREPEADFSMDFAAERSSRGGTSFSLHNFSSLPRWGTRKQFRCVKPSELTRHSLSLNRRSDVDDGSDDGDDGDDEVDREKLMIYFRTEVDKLQSECLNQGKNSAVTVTVAEAAEEAGSRPWNLRTRRAVCKDPCTNGGNNVVYRKPNFYPARYSGRVNSPARNGRCEGNGEERGKKPDKFSNSLSKSEIEADFIALTDTRPTRRPKKRAKLIQTRLNKLLPGFLLAEITADMYKVDEPLPASRKKY